MPKQRNIKRKIGKNRNQ